MYGDDPYVFHLDMVADVLKSYGFGEVVQAAGYLHDVIEDTAIDAAALRAAFPDEVVQIVEAVTDEPGANRRERKAKTLPKIRAAGTSAVAVKLADRICNIAISKAKNLRLYEMYMREHPAFEKALRISGELDRMWEHAASYVDEPRAFVQG